MEVPYMKLQNQWTWWFILWFPSIFPNICSDNDFDGQSHIEPHVA